MTPARTLLTAVLTGITAFVLLDLVACSAVEPDLVEATAPALEVLPPVGDDGPTMDDPAHGGEADDALMRWCVDQLEAGVCALCETAPMYCEPDCDETLGEPCLALDPVGCAHALEACGRCELCTNYQQPAAYEGPIPALRLDPHVRITDPPPPAPDPWWGR